MSLLTKRYFSKFCQAQSKRSGKKYAAVVTQPLHCKCCKMIFLELIFNPVNMSVCTYSDAEPAWRTQATKMTSSEAFVETMVSHGTSHVFGIVGSAFMDALDIFEPAGIRFLPVQHEQNAVHMADGFSRVTNSPGVCIAQNGPGITNFVTGVAAAYWAHSPVVVITPETGSLTNGLGGFQETNQVSNEGTKPRIFP